MRDAGRLEAVVRVRPRARRRTSSTEGFRANSISSARRCSWSDRPARAARAASSSRTSSGTSRTVIEGMPAVCCYRIHFASNAARSPASGSVGVAEDVDEGVDGLLEPLQSILLVIVTAAAEFTDLIGEILGLLAGLVEVA